MRKFFKKGRKLSVIYAVITFIALLVITQLLVYQRHRAIAMNEYNELVLELDDTRDKLNIVLNQNISSAKTLVILYRQNRSLTWFDDVAKELMEMNQAIDYVEYIDKDFFITRIYPLKGNEHMIGFNVMSEPTRRAETKLALADKDIKFSGPYELLQGGGGMGIAGRLPIYDGDSFIGGAVVITRMSTIQKRMPELENKGKVFTYQLSKVDAITKKREYFFNGYNPQKDWQVTRFMRRGNWTLHAAYVDGYISHGTIYLLSVFGILLSGLGAYFVYNKTYEAVRLGEAVQMKTRDLGERMKELSAIYQVNEILKDERQSMDIALSRVVKVIPSGFRYPDACAAHIVIGDNEYTTGDCSGKLYHMQAPMSFNDEIQGYVEVSYTRETPIEEEGPFLKDERNLLNALAETIEVYYNKKLHRDRVTRSEASMRTLIEAMPFGVLLANVSGNILAVNSTMQVIFAALSVRSLSVGDHFIEAVRPDRKEQVQAMFTRVAEDMEPIEYDVKYGTEDAPIYLNINMIPVVSNAESIGVCITVADITDRKKVEMEYRRVNADLMQHMNAVVEFTRAITEKVSTPVSVITGLKAKLQNGIDEQERKTITDEIVKLAEQLQHVVTDLNEVIRKDND